MQKPDDEMLSILRMWGESVSIGTTSVHVCPACGGGSTVEKSFRLSRVEPDTLLYCCHRASCGVHGACGRAYSFVGSSHTGEDKKSDPEPYNSPVQRLGSAWVSELLVRYGITETRALEEGWLEEINSHRLVVPIRAMGGGVRGIHTRRSTTDTEYALPKTRDYRYMDPWMGWFWPGWGTRPRREIVLVEDVLSAAKVAQSGYICASLMGSHFGLDHIIEAFKFERERIRILALDRDATNKAINAASEYAFIHGGRLIPMPLRVDLKYESEDSIRRMIENVAPF